MCFLSLLAVKDDRIDIVTDAVRNWCATHGHEMSDGSGKMAMETAIALALGDPWDGGLFPERLRQELDSASTT